MGARRADSPRRRSVMTTIGHIEGSRLAGRVSIVTGGGSGIGEAIGRRFRSEGAFVVAAGLQPECPAALSKEAEIVWHTCDVTQERDVQDMVDRVLREQGKVDVLVNAAGVMRIDDVGEIEDDIWSVMLDVNLTGAMRICRAVLPAMRRQRGGSIVNVASVAAFNASPGMASYSASKAGLVALTRSIANRYGEEGVRANCLCPGWVRTPMSEAEMQAAAHARGTNIETEFEKAAGRIALRRVARPEEIAACAAFLASDDSSFVTGAILVADGGARRAIAS